MIENIDIGGPTLIRAAAKNHAFSAVVVAPGELRRGAGGAARRRTACCRCARARPGAGGVRLHGALRRGDLALVRRARGRLPGPVHARVREGARPLLRREPAPARGLLRGGRRAHAPAVDGVEAARQGAVVQQPAGPRLGPAAGRGVRAAGRGDHQAQQPVRGGGGRGARARRSTRRSPPIRRARSAGCSASTGRSTGRSPRSSARCSSRWCSRRATTRTRSRCSSRSRTSGCSRTRSGARTPVSEHDIKRVRGGMLVQDRDTGLEQRDEMQVVTRAQAERGGVGRAAVRLAGVQARALERDRAGEGPGHGGHRRGPDEPGGLGADRRREGAPPPSWRWTARRWPRTRSSRSPTAPRLAIDAGVRAIIQPGGSQRDHEVMDACDAAGVAMVFTARRHFRH